MATLIASARAGARAIRAAYGVGRRVHQEITERAQSRFERREWAEARRDAQERLDLYRQAVEGVRDELHEILGEDFEGAALWRQLREFYSETIAHDPARELAETFFNSVTRKVFETEGVNADIEYVDLDPRRDHYGHGFTVHRKFERTGDVRGAVEAILKVPRFSAPFHDLERDIERVSAAVEEAWAGAGTGCELESIDVIDPTFFRGTGAYVIGRMRGADKTTLVPLVIVLLHAETGIEADAVLTTELELSILFSYTRSHFLVAGVRPVDLVEFLRSVLPKKPIPELYIALGYPKHGKTEMYRDLIGNLTRSMDQFAHAPGEVGMVMIVFAKPAHDYVFKIIRDRFAPPKTSTRADVLDRYRLVSRHDRAGRMIEAQEFENLVFDRWRFTPELLEELQSEAAETVEVGESQVLIRHLYVERRVEPLNLFLRRADDADALRAVRDYGQAIRDLATTNIFPGDLLLKNFGVTKSGRVTFYDYDELCLVTDCQFRDLPTARTHQEELAAEPWYYVGEDDVFPEEFFNFMGLNKPQREAFLADHAEVLTPGFWRDLQARHRAGEVMDIFAYPPSRRLASR